MKERYGIGEYTDQQLAERQEEEAVIVVRIPKPNWHLVCQQPGGRARVLVLAEKGGAPAVLSYLETMSERKLMYWNSYGRSSL